MRTAREEARFREREALAAELARQRVLARAERARWRAYQVALAERQRRRWRWQRSTARAAWKLFKRRERFARAWAALDRLLRRERKKQHAGWN